MSSEFPVLDEIELLARHEEALGKLYSAYSKEFHEHSEFWGGLADEEVGHANWIRKFKETCKRAECNIDEGRFRSRAIEKSTDFINGHIQMAMNSNVSLLLAASTAVDLEHALLDKNFFEVYESDDPELVKTLNWLKQETVKHKKKVEEFLDMVRGQHHTAIG